MLQSPRAWISVARISVARISVGRISVARISVVRISVNRMSDLVLEDTLAQGIGGAVDASGQAPEVRSVGGRRLGDTAVARSIVIGWVLLLGCGLLFEVGTDSIGGLTLSNGGSTASAVAFLTVSAGLFALSFVQRRVPRLVLIGALTLFTLNLGARSYFQAAALSRPGTVILTRLNQDELGAKTRILAKRLSRPRSLPSASSSEGSPASGLAPSPDARQPGSQKPLWVDWGVSPSSEPAARQLLQTNPTLGAVLYGSPNRLNLILPESHLKIPYGSSHLSLIDSASVVTIGGRNESEVADFTADLVAAISLGRSRANPELELEHLKSAYNLPGTWFSPDHQALVALKVGNRLLAQALVASPNSQLIQSAQVWFKSAAKRTMRGDNRELRQAIYYSQAVSALLRAQLEATSQTMHGEVASNGNINPKADISRDADRSKSKVLKQRLRYFTNGIRNCEQSFRDEAVETQSGSARGSELNKTRKKPRAKRTCFVPKWFYETAVSNFTILH